RRGVTTPRFSKLRSVPLLIASASAAPEIVKSRQLIPHSQNSITNTRIELELRQELQKARRLDDYHRVLLCSRHLLPSVSPRQLARNGSDFPRRQLLAKP